MQTQIAAKSESAAARAGRFGWVGAVALGGVIFLLAPVVPILAEGFDPFFLILVVPPLIGLVLLRFARRVAIVWLGVVSAALLLMNAGFIPDALAHPESPADFVPVSMLTVAGLLAVAAAVPAFRVARGKASDSRLPRILGGMAVALVLAAAAVSVVAPKASPAMRPLPEASRWRWRTSHSGPERSPRRAVR